MILDSAFIAVGFALLLIGAEYLIRGAVGIARRLNISLLVIGLTVVALGTSLPELTVSLKAALHGSPGIAFGNIVGSNIANILLILGAAALIHPMTCSKAAVYRDGMTMLAATVMFVGLAMTGSLGFWSGLASVLALVGYLYYSYRRDQASGEDLHAQEVEEVGPLSGSIWLLSLAVIGGPVGVIVGADMLVRGSVGIARVLGVSEEVIGLTLVAFGTSLPELATTVVAAMRRHGDVALGNVLGSNLFNLLGVMGAVTMVVPMEVPPKIGAFDIWVMLGVTILLFPCMRSGWRLNRGEAGLFLTVYAAFIAAQFFGVGEMVMSLAAR